MPNPTIILVKENYYPLHCDINKSYKNNGVCFCLENITPNSEGQVDYRNCRKYIAP